MADRISLIAFAVLTLLFAGTWAGLLWFCAEKSRRVRVWSLYLMAVLPLEAAQARSVLLSVIYYVPGILGSLLFAHVYHLRLETLFCFRLDFIPLIILGIIAEISVANLLVGFYLGLKRINPCDEVQAIPWIRGLSVLPPRLQLPLAALSALFEEVFFRGVILLILIRVHNTPPSVALIMTTGLFVFQQALQLKTSIQLAIIACSCVAISGIGGLLVLITNSIIPAALCHMAFVVFFFGYSRISTPAGPGSGRGTA